MSSIDRREFLKKLGKWSMVVGGVALLGLSQAGCYFDYDDGYCDYSDGYYDDYYDDYSDYDDKNKEYINIKGNFGDYGDYYGD